MTQQLEVAMPAPPSKRPAEPDAAVAVPAPAVKKPCLEANGVECGPGGAVVKRPPVVEATVIDPELEKFYDSQTAQFTGALQAMCDAPPRDSFVELRSALLASDVVRNGLAALSSASAETLGPAPSFDHNPLFACIIEGSTLTLNQLQDHISEMINKAWPSDVVCDTVIKIADRKAYGVKVNKKNVVGDLNENDESKYRWRWEVLQKDLIPAELRKWVFRERAIEGVMKKLMQVRDEGVRTAQARKADARLKLLRFNDETERLVSELEQKIAANQSTRDAERLQAEKRQQKQVDKSAKASQTPSRKLKQQENKMSKEAQFMAGFLSSPVHPVKLEMPTSRIRRFMPFYIPANTTMAPTLPGGEVCDADLQLFDRPEEEITDLISLRSRRPSFRLGIRKKLLQFHTEVRPPYFSVFRKRSCFVRPRCPFGRDPALFYTLDSDDEWEDGEEGEDVDGSSDDESEDEVDPECSRRRDGLEEDGWLDPEELDIAANLPETTNSSLRIVGPVYVPDAIHALNEEERSELLDRSRIVINDVLDAILAPPPPPKPTGPQTATITQFFQRKTASVH